MPVENKKIRSFFNLSCYVALAVCLISIPFWDPFRSKLVPPLQKFVKTYFEILLNLLYFIFFICSMALVILAHLVHREYLKLKSLPETYRSELIVKNYYEKPKAYDFTMAIATAISKYSRRDLGLVDSTETVITDGTHQTFYPNGQLEKEFTYKNGKLNGPWFLYYTDGILHQEKNYKDNKLHGAFRAYDDLGILFFEIDYKDGLKHGVEKSFFRSGSIQYVDTYTNGKRINRKTYNESGELQFDYNYHNDK